MPYFDPGYFKKTAKVNRNVKRSDPKDCKLILNETYNYSFYKKKISVGTLWFCS